MSDNDTPPPEEGEPTPAQPPNADIYDAYDLILMGIDEGEGCRNYRD